MRVTTSTFWSGARRDAVIPSCPNVSFAQARPRSSYPAMRGTQKAAWDLPGLFSMTFHVKGFGVAYQTRKGLWLILIRTR